MPKQASYIQLPFLPIDLFLADRQAANNGYGHVGGQSSYRNREIKIKD